MSDRLFDDERAGGTWVGALPEFAHAVDYAVRGAFPINGVPQDLAEAVARLTKLGEQYEAEGRAVFELAEQRYREQRERWDQERIASRARK